MDRYHGKTGLKKERKTRRLKPCREFLLEVDQQILVLKRVGAEREE